MESKHPNIVYLLGAGASRGLGLPTSRDLVSQFPQWLKELGADETAQGAVEAVLARLRLRHVQVNFEEFLTTLLHLVRRHELDIWPLVDRLCEPFESVLRVAPGHMEALYDIALDGLRRALTRPDRSALRKDYLDRLVDMAMESSRPAIFTLNYDLSVEATLESRGIPYANGFQKSPRPSRTALAEFEEYKLGWLQVGEIPPTAEAYFGADFESEFWPRKPRYSPGDVSTGLFERTPNGQPAKIRLVKVHGSLDWFRAIAPPRYLEMAGARQPKLAAQDPIVRRAFHPYIPTDAAEEVIIAGRWDKERSEEPYVSLLREFYAGVMASDVVVVIGYSFSDAHINRVLTTAQVWDRSRGLDMVVVNGPNWPGRISPVGRDAWRLLVAAGEESEKREGFSGVTVVPEYAEAALMGGALEAALKEVIDRRGIW